MVSSSGEMVTMEFPVAENLRLRAKARDAAKPREIQALGATVSKARPARFALFLSEHAGVPVGLP